MAFDLFLYIFVYAVWLVYIVNSIYQNRKMKHYLPNKPIELLTIPFYILAVYTFFILDKGLMNILSKKIPLSIFSSFFSLPSILLGIIFLVLSVILYAYLNFFTESFPSCIAMKNNRPLEGIYKYVRHPSCYTFLFICFGTALCLQNFAIFVMAIVNHICLYFYYMIEESQIRKTSPYYNEYLKKSNRVLPNFIKFKK